MNEEILISKTEGELLSNIVEAILKLDGDIVEIGVFRGGSAEIICQKKKDKILHLFDTWQGIVSLSPEDNKSKTRFNIGRYFAPKEVVEKKLSKFTGVKLYQGEFPISYENNIKIISLLHLDVDLFKPTKESLNLFWSKIITGGCVVVHDYPTFEGVRLAVDDYLKDKHFIKIQLTYEQCLIIKLS